MVALKTCSLHISLGQSIFIVIQSVVLRLDRVGPVDNRPSTNKLQHFVKSDMWHLEGGEPSLKM